MFLELLILHLAAAGISLVGLAMVWHHRAQWHRQSVDENVEEGERIFLFHQFRRRTQSSAVIVVLGCLMHASNEHLVAWQKAPAGFFVYVCVMLALVAWIVLLAFADFAASRLVHLRALGKLHEQQLQMEQAARELRNRERG